VRITDALLPSFPFSRPCWMWCSLLFEMSRPSPEQMSSIFVFREKKHSPPAEVPRGALFFFRNRGPGKQSLFPFFPLKKNSGSSYFVFLFNCIFFFQQEDKTAPLQYFEWARGPFFSSCTDWEAARDAFFFPQKSWPSRQSPGLVPDQIVLFVSACQTYVDFLTLFFAPFPFHVPSLVGTNSGRMDRVAFLLSRRPALPFSPLWCWWDDARAEAGLPLAAIELLPRFST